MRDSVYCAPKHQIEPNGIKAITAITIPIKMCHRIHFQSVEAFAFLRLTPTDHVRSTAYRLNATNTHI